MKQEPTWKTTEDFSSLLPLRCKLLCRPSEWVRVTIESEPPINPTDSDTMFLNSLKLPLETEFPSEYFTEMLLSYIFRLIVVILSNNRCINLSIKTSEFTKMKQESTWKTTIFVAYCLLSVSYYAVLLSKSSATLESEPSKNPSDF